MNFSSRDVKEIEGKIEYDYKAIDKFKTSMIISIALIFTITAF